MEKIFGPSSKIGGFFDKISSLEALLSGRNKKNRFFATFSTLKKKHFSGSKRI
jgi:hypothetical protein